MDPGPPGHHTVTPSLPSPGLMGRAIPEQHSPHLKEQHHIRGSITQGTLPSPSPQTPSPQTPSPRPLVRFCPQAEYRLGIWKQRARPPPPPPIHGLFLLRSDRFSSVLAMSFTMWFQFVSALHPKKQVQRSQFAHPSSHRKRGFELSQASSRRHCWEPPQAEQAQAVESQCCLPGRNPAVICGGPGGLLTSGGQALEARGHPAAPTAPAGPD